VRIGILLFGLMASQVQAAKTLEPRWGAWSCKPDRASLCITEICKPTEKNRGFMISDGYSECGEGVTCYERKDAKIEHGSNFMFVGFDGGGFIEIRRDLSYMELRTDSHELVISHGRCVATAPPPRINPPAANR
jgi:hypothetical protein